MTALSSKIDDTAWTQLSWADLLLTQIFSQSFYGLPCLPAEASA